MGAIKYSIVIRIEGREESECKSAIIVPEKALTEAGYIRTLSANSSAHSKHEFHALTHIALTRLEDGELETELVRGPVLVRWRNGTETLNAGAVILLDLQGDLHLICHAGLNVKDFIKTAHRFCTRQVRLDI